MSHSHSQMLNPNIIQKSRQAGFPAGKLVDSIASATEEELGHICYFCAERRQSKGETPWSKRSRPPRRIQRKHFGNDPKKQFGGE